MSTYSKGDHVVCPPHGAGTVTKVEKRDGKNYLSIELDLAGMKVMIPDDAVEERGIRGVVSKAEAGKVIKTLQSEHEELPSNQQRRARFVAETTREGDAHGLAQLLRDIAALTADDRKLTVTEQRTFDEARRQLASELALSRKVSTEQAFEMIDKAIGEDLAS